MRLYRSKGHVWTGTEADAKAANDGMKGWEKIEVPTDKPSLIAWLNQHAPGKPPAADVKLFGVDMASQPDMTGTMTLLYPVGGGEPIVIDAVAEQEKAKAHMLALAAEEAEPEPVSAYPLVERAPKTTKARNVIERISVEEIIWESDAQGLASLQRIINERRGELQRMSLAQEAEEADVLPKPRIRVRVPVQPVATNEGEHA